MLRPRSASLAHLARSSAASNGLLNPVWRSRLAPLRSSAPKPAPELYTPLAPARVLDEAAPLNLATGTAEAVLHHEIITCSNNGAPVLLRCRLA